MPEGSPAVKIANTRAYGAEVVLYDRARENRDAIGARSGGECAIAAIVPVAPPARKARRRR